MSVFGATVLVLVLLVGAIVAMTTARRKLRDGGSSGDVAAAQRSYLASNWDEVEAAAARSGMSPEEIAAVRRKLLGA